MSDPARSAAHLAAARRFVQEQNLGQALLAAKAAAEADPANTEAFAYWGVSAAETGRFAEAIEPLAVAADRNVPGTFGWANLVSQRARALSNVGFWGEAFHNASAVERARLDDPSIRHRIGTAFARIGLSERALPHLEWAARAAPERAEMLFELGVAYLSLGRSLEAEALLERSIALSPAWAQPHMALASLRRWTSADAHVERLRALRDRPETDAGDRASLGFALFKELDDLREPGAWSVLEEANAQARALEPAWTVQSDRDLVQALIDRFPVELFSASAPSTRRARPRSRTPIFVVGLPRSGTTLVERILAAHPRVGSIGEAPSFPVLFRGCSTAADRRELSPAVIAATAGADWPALADRYLRETACLTGDAPFIVDKLPLNSLLVGALRLAFPEAPIVLLRRGPMDNLFSVFRVQFSGAYLWANRQQDMAEHFAQHLRLMDHWKACLGNGLIEVRYEDLVRNPEVEVPRLLEACGLEFDEACLRPDEAAGSVRTASIVQVRRPISDASVGGWRRYADEMEPLRARLEALGVPGA